MIFHSCKSFFCSKKQPEIIFCDSKSFKKIISKWKFFFWHRKWSFPKRTKSFLELSWKWFRGSWKWEMISVTHQTYYHYFCKGKVRAQEMISASFCWKSFPFVHLCSRAITHDVYLKEMSEKLALYLPCKRNVFVEKNSFLMFTRDRGRSRMMFTERKDWKSEFLLAL